MCFCGKLKRLFRCIASLLWFIYYDPFSFIEDKSVCFFIIRNIKTQLKEKDYSCIQLEFVL